MYNRWYLVIAIMWSISLTFGILSGRYPTLGIVILFTVILINLELGAHPITCFAHWIRLQIALHRERAQRRREYKLFKRGVKSGLYADEQVEDENRRIVE